MTAFVRTKPVDACEICKKNWRGSKRVQSLGGWGARTTGWRPRFQSGTGFGLCSRGGARRASLASGNIRAPLCGGEESGLTDVKPYGILNHMVVDQSPRLDLVFHALAHPARRAIIRQLSGGERNLSELASPLRMTFPAATKHVRVLERAKLVRRRVLGRQHLCRLRAAPLREAVEWTEQFRKNWEARFEVLDSLLEAMKQEEAKSADVKPAERGRARR